MLDIAANAGASAPALRVNLQGRTLRVAPAGRWCVQDFARLDAEIKALNIDGRKREIGEAEIHLSIVEDLDTAGAWMLHHLKKQFEAAGIPAAFKGASEKQQILLGVVGDNTVAEKPARIRRGPVVPLFGDAANAVLKAVGDLVQLTAFLGATTACAFRTAMRPWRFRWTAFIHHIEHTGLRAVPIIALICLLIGAVITQQGVLQLRTFGAEPFAVDMVGILALREVGILLTAIMVAGRSASAFTAEIGSMKMREEIDAMRTLGIDPIETLVLPRVAALIVALPILAFIGNIMCLAGGGLMAMVYLDISIPAYIDRLHDAVSLRHLLVGLVKAPLAALIIGLVGCLEGMSVSGSAESLGTHVTSSVVKAIFLVIIFDAMFAMYLSASGY
ncbi:MULTISPECIES: ABC transporter permease [Rhodomicrobium]|uniref:MlaE family ABC transporter permease n=1 Tax=Rhodomicrobium TaxID=1068 RepID=UPI00148214A8|nr:MULTISPECIES: ABC transporter permease [Rhodomicrobium]